MNHIIALFLNQYLIRPIREEKEASPPPVTQSKPVAFPTDLQGSWDTQNTSLPNTARREYPSPVGGWEGRTWHTEHCQPLHSLQRNYWSVATKPLHTIWADSVEGATANKRFCLFSSVKSVPLWGWEDWTEWARMKTMLLWRGQPPPHLWLTGGARLCSSSVPLPKLSDPLPDRGSWVWEDWALLCSLARLLAAPGFVGWTTGRDSGPALSGFYFLSARGGRNNERVNPTQRELPICTRMKAGGLYHLSGWGWLSGGE